MLKSCKIKNKKFKKLYGKNKKSVVKCFSNYEINKII